jgi:hypothetical protein
MSFAPPVAFVRPTLGKTFTKEHPAGAPTIGKHDPHKAAVI